MLFLAFESECFCCLLLCGLDGGDLGVSVKKKKKMDGEFNFMNFHFNLASQAVPNGVTYFVDKMALGEIIYVG